MSQSVVKGAELKLTIESLAYGGMGVARYENFVVFVKKAIPDNIDEYKMVKAERLLDVLTKNNMVSSNGEAKRLIKQGAIKIDDAKVSDMNLILEIEEQVIKCGKRKFLKIVQ